MKRGILLAVTLTALGVAAWFVIPRPGVESRPWKTTDVWYHESDPSRVGATGRPQLVEFFHPD